MEQETPKTGFFQNPDTQLGLIVVAIGVAACCLIGSIALIGMSLFGGGVTIPGLTTEVATVQSTINSQVDRPTEPPQSATNTQTEQPTEPPPNTPDNQAQQPTETPQSEPAQIEVEVLDVGWYTTVIDSFYAIGLVENTGNVDLVYVKVTATLLDEQGQIMASDYGYADTDLMQVGAVAPFAVLFSEGVPDGWTDYEISIEASEAYDSDWYYHYTAFEIISSESVDPEYGDYAIQGEVKNTGQLDAEFVKVTAVLYDANGNITGTDWTYVGQDRSELKSGEAVAFMINVMNIIHPVDHYDLLVEGRRVDVSESQFQ